LNYEWELSFAWASTIFKCFTFKQLFCPNQINRFIVMVPMLLYTPRSAEYHMGHLMSYASVDIKIWHKSIWVILVSLSKICCHWLQNYILVYQLWSWSRIVFIWIGSLWQLLWIWFPFQHLIQELRSQFIKESEKRLNPQETLN
jgi:hypothetical protein